MKKHAAVAGLTMNPRDVRDVSANGFATDKTLMRLLEDAKNKGNKTAESSYNVLYDSMLLMCIYLVSWWYRKECQAKCYFAPKI